MLNRKCFLVFILAFFTFISFSHAIQPIRIKTSISASDKIKKSLRKCFQKELWTLEDVEVVEENPDINIIVMGMRLQSGKKSKDDLFAVSAIVTEPFKNEDLGFLMKEYSESAHKLYAIVTSDLIYLQGFWMKVDPDLKEVCKYLVNKFDNAALTSFRERRQEIKQDEIKEDLPHQHDLPEITPEEIGGTTE